MVSEIISMLILAIVQGISEWLPISSSGHLVLFSRLLGFENSIQFDVALHFGTLMAVFVYFGRDITNIVEAILKGKWKSEEAKLGFLVLFSAIPAALAGYFLKDVFEAAFSSLWIVMIGFLITSLVLLIASLNQGSRTPIKNKFGYYGAFLVGCAQAVAIVPGISRSGATISAGLLLGLDMKRALRFSFLMSIPVIFGANVLELGNSILPTSYIVPTLVAFVSGLIAIYFMFRIFENSRKNLRWFALYCFLLALGLFAYLVFRV